MKTKIIGGFILFIFILIVVSVFTTDNISKKKYNLERDGCCLLKNCLDRQDIDTLSRLCKEERYKEAKRYIVKHKSILARIRKKVSKSYNFQDYILIIQKSAIHTCHRDYNGDLFNDGQQHPSYTVLIYLDEMEKCLGVIPESHKSKHSYAINLTNQVEHVACKKGDILLFDANLIHVGALNEKEDNLRIQMKITHNADVEILDYYEDYNKVLNQPNHLPKSMVKFQRDVSCMFPIVSTLTQNDAMKQSTLKTQSHISKAFSYVFYGNSDFYNLKTAF